MTTLPTTPDRQLARDREHGLTRDPAHDQAHGLAHDLAAHGAAGVERTRPSPLRVLRHETGEELRAVLREPVTLFFSILMPVGFFALFGSLWGQQEAAATTVGTTMLATFGTFGVIGVTLLTPGIALAEDRERGWLRVKRVSATPLPVSLAAKVLACLPHAAGVLLAMTLVAALIGTLEIGPATWLRLTGSLLIGGLPFALLGMAVGAVVSPNAATAVLMAMFLPSAVASGLWMPLDMLPATMQQLAPALPTYHLAELALAQIHGSSGLPHAAALLGFTAGAAVLAGFAYRRARA